MGKKAFKNFRIRLSIPGAGIIHQINLEHLAQCVFEKDGSLLKFLKTLVCNIP